MSVRVLIIDDSAPYRVIVRRILQNDPNIEVVGTAANGQQGLQLVEELKPDVVTLDQEMPKLSGLQVLESIQKREKDLSNDKKTKVLMISSHTTEGAKITLEALQKGALDFIAKPQLANQEANMRHLSKELLPKIKAISKPDFQSIKPSQATPSRSAPLIVKAPIELIAIGSSTGGPQALNKILPVICRNTTLPICIVQHMPPVFTKSLAESLNKTCRHQVVEAQDGEAITNFKVYLAPGDYHMVVEKSDRQHCIRLHQEAPEHFCRPAVDVMFRSIANTFGNKALGIVLTGMGCDGTSGLSDMKQLGSPTIAQDRESSVVWGMPGSAVQAGIIDHTCPLDDIPHITQQLCQSSTSKR